MYKVEANENLKNFSPVSLWYSSFIFQHTEKSIKHASNSCWSLDVPTAAHSTVLIFFAILRF
jgi:hypothetical protein